MASYSDVTNFLLTTDADSNKNLSITDNEFSQAAISLSAGTYKLVTYEFDISEDTRLYQVYVNLSIDGDFWTALPCRDRQYSNNRVISMNLSQTGTTVSLNVYYVNQDASTRSFSAMTVTIKVRDFVDEIT